MSRRVETLKELQSYSGKGFMLTQFNSSNSLTFLTAFIISKDLPFWTARARVYLPQACSAQERIAIMPAFDSFRQLIQSLGVTTAQHDVIGNERFLQLDERVLDVAAPGFLTEPLQAWFAKIVFNDAAVAIGKVSQFEQENVIVPDKG